MLSITPFGSHASIHNEALSQDIMCHSEAVASRSGDHPPRAANHRYQDQTCQNPSSRLRSSGDHVLGECWVVVRDATSAASRRIALACASSLVGNRHADLVNQIGLNDRERSHLLPHTLCTVPFGALSPFHSAHLAIGTAGALQRGCGSRRLDPRHYGTLDEGGVFDRCDEPACQIGLEGIVVRIAGVGRFAGDFVHDVRRIGSEENRGGVEDTQNSLLPESRTIGL